MNHQQQHQVQPQRLDNTTTCLPIVYGSIAYNLGSDAIDEYHTHRWTLYVRSPAGNLLLSPNIISKVIFTLHPSFAQPTCEVCNPPYEVSEVGWGEFEASIRIVWNSNISYERSTLVTHLIRLYPTIVPTPVTTAAAIVATQPPMDDGNTIPTTTTDATINTTTTTTTTTNPVISERYDEVVFTNPTIEFHTALITAASSTATDTSSTSSSSQNNVITKVWNDNDESKIMIMAKTYLEQQLQTIKERLVYIDMEIENVKRDTATAIQQQQQLLLSNNTNANNNSTTTTTAGTKAELAAATVTKKNKKMDTTVVEEGGESKKKKNKKNTSATIHDVSTSSLGVVL